MKDQYIALKGGRLLDGKGGEPVEDSILVIKGERIEAVGKAASVPTPPQAELIDILLASVADKK